MPKKLPKKRLNAQSFLLILESPLINLANWDLRKHQYFHKIFTWNDDYIDNIKYFKINYAFQIPDKIDFISIKKEKLCTMIAANKGNCMDQQLLYNERVKAIRWFEKNHPLEFDLYGFGWSNPIVKRPNFFWRYRENTPPFTSYRGEIATKQTILSKYKFSICYENAKDFPGYITEKIFDCFFAGCVPIYWGAPNVKNHIPQNTFIDK